MRVLATGNRCQENIKTKALRNSRVNMKVHRGGHLVDGLIDFEVNNSIVKHQWVIHFYWFGITLRGFQNLIDEQSKSI